MNGSEERKWYKKWWGILLIVLLFPFFIVYLLLLKVKINDKLKLIISFILPCIMTFVFVPSIKYTQIGEIEDVSYGSIKRYAVNIAVPENITEYQVSSIIKEVASKIDKDNSANAVAVYLYFNGDNLLKGYTVAMGVYAPGGEWSNADISIPKQYHIEYNLDFLKELNDKKNK